jgi:pimeloyl-ACP methyl ester carboxylesterase
MKWLQRLTDRLVLYPTTDPIDPGELERGTITVQGGVLEAWKTTWNPGAEHKVLLIKFPGNAGRAERATPNPGHLWQDVCSEVWAVNPFGYGGSVGPATLQRYPEMVEAVYKELRPKFPEHKLIVYGRSLGSISALAMAARFPVDGLYLRDPVPIHQMISTRKRYALPSLGLSRLVAGQIPPYLDAVANAQKCAAPCLFLTSGQDSVVPPEFQAQVIEQFTGPSEVLELHSANHNDPIPNELEVDYRAKLNWLRNEVLK